MSDLQALQSLLAAFHVAAPGSASAPASTPPGGVLQAELRETLARALLGLPEQERERVHGSIRELESQLQELASAQDRLRDSLRQVAGQLRDEEAARMVAESLAPSRVGELTPSHQALGTAFARGAAKAVEASRAAGLPVHAMDESKVVKVTRNEP